MNHPSQPAKLTACQVPIVGLLQLHERTCQPRRAAEACQIPGAILACALRTRRQHRAGELRISGTIAPPARERVDGAKKRTLHRQWRRSEYDHIAELPCAEGELQQVRHALGVGVPKPREAKKKFSIIWAKRSPGVTSTRHGSLRRVHPTRAQPLRTTPEGSPFQDGR